MDKCSQPGLMPLADGLQKLLSLITPNQETTLVSLENAKHRVLVSDIQAPISVPSFNNSAMDGFAFSANDIVINQPFSIQGKSFAGKPFTQTLKPQHAVKIMTGAALPDGADCVIMQENTTSTPNFVTPLNVVKAGENVRKIGDDIKKGSTLLKSGTQLNAAHLGLLSSVGIATVNVYQKTKVGLLSTGDELKQPGETLAFGEIYNSNRFAIAAMLKNLNVDIIDYGTLKDDPEAFRQAFLKADSECDFVITSGGVSVGEADYTKEVLEELGHIEFWKLAIKPGKPFAFGQLPNSYFIGLPGNPVSAIVTLHILASQAIRAHQHVGYKPMKTLIATTTHTIHKNPGRMDFQRGVWQLNGNNIEVTPTTQTQGSHILTSLAEANCYLALEQERATVSPGESVTIWLFDNVI